MTKLLSRHEVMQVLQMADVIDILEKTFADLANENADMPQRTPISTPDHGGKAFFMPAYLKGIGALGAKVETLYEDNPTKYEMKAMFGIVILLDEKTGAPVAIMDGNLLTAMRTGGVAGLATKLLAREDASVHALFGAGDLAGAHALAVDNVRSLEKLILYSIDPPDKREKFREILGGILDCDCEIVLADDPEAAVGEADIVTLITSAKEPIVDGDWFKPGTHINGVGSDTPETRELDSKTIQNSKVFCDHVDACKVEAGDLIIPIEAGEYSWDKLHGSLGDVIIGKIPGRESEDEITLFKSVGLAIQDISTALHVYNEAQGIKLGTEFDFVG